MTFLAAIDIGSNALRLLLGEFIGGRLVQTHNFREAVRLGQDVFSSGFIGEGRACEFLGAIERFKQICKEFRVKHIHAVATSALREARNGDKVVQKIYRKTRIRIELISGTQEAALIVEAVRAYCPHVEHALLIDIGGGSVEVSQLRKDEVAFAVSEKLGAVRLLRMYQRDRRRAEAAIQYFAAKVAQRIGSMKKSDRPRTAVVTGGNAETLAGLKKRLLGRKDTATLSYKELVSIVRRVESVSYAQRVSTLGLKPDRADIIVPAGRLLRCLVKTVKSKEILIPRVGLKDGVLLRLAQDKLGSFVIDPDV